MARCRTCCSTPPSFCSSSFVVEQPSSPATGNAWPERGQVLSPPGGVTYLRVLAPFSATGLATSLADGTVAGTSEDDEHRPGQRSRRRLQRAR